ncbi:TetR family transcriptional regulator [Mycetocola tolaasinivorans]|uniref:TetR family transcriptional regulator n=1 Tax=Mycetocola tolaasinivorans TaxID=76635 RepID=A0A3L7A923_9MICO|nr:TetR family transcriptional regulator [Mycetocola tolaasinivorans]RLP76906.1 TetR family transcriptional regulator [Mycetocola tolaasinivorans]
MAVAHRPKDPQRREKIIAATLDVIAEHGISGTTHRRIAAAAEVPLGSMTYYFTGLEELLTEAFMLLATTTSARYVEILDAATTRAEAREAMVEIITGDIWETPRTLTLSYELYAFSIKNERVREVIRHWMSQSRVAIGRHFDPMTTYALDAAIEGLTIHRSFQPEITLDMVREIVDRLTRNDAPTASL